MNDNQGTRSKEINNASWLIAGRLAQMIISFIVSIFTARYLGPSNYGLINYAAAYVVFFTSLCTLGLNSIAVKEIIEKPDAQGKTIGTMMGFRLASSILSSCTIVAIVAIVDSGEPLTLGVAALCSVQLVFHVADTINYWFQSQYRSKVTAIVTLIAYLITSAYKVLLLILHKNVLWFAFATSVDFIAMGLLLMLAYNRYGGKKLSFSFNRGKTLLSSSYHYILSGMMVAIYSQTDRIMLKQMLSETDVGYYSLAASINVMWVFVLQAMIDSVYPTIIRLYNDNYNQYEKKNRQLYAIIMYVSFFVAIVIMIVGKRMVIIVYGDAYADASNPLRILAWLTAFSYLGVARNAWIVCENKQKYLKYMYCGAAILNILLNIILIPTWGASGAAVASLVTQICTSILLPSLIKDMRPNVALMLDALLLRKIR